jgi:hypothetical protein
LVLLAIYVVSSYDISKVSRVSRDSEQFANRDHR